MNARLLIIDDDPLNLITSESILAPEGHEIHCLSQSEQAIETIVAIRPDLVLLDVMMPVLDGFEVCRRIRAHPAISQVPVIMITALHDRESRLKGLSVGADDFITKPCSFEELRARVRTVVKLNRFRLIAEQRARFQNLFELAPAKIALVDHRGIVIAANAKAARLFPEDSDPVEGRRLPAQFPEESARILREAIAEICASAATSVSPRQLRRPSADGSGEQVFTLEAARVEEDGFPLAMLILSDITAEVRAREAVEDMNRRLDVLVAARTRQLEDANNLLMSYAVFVSHDLRSPLSVVKGYLSLITDGVIPIPAEARDCINHSYTATLMLEEMIRNILQLASDECSGEAIAEAVDPRPIIERLAWKLVAYHRRPKPQILVAPDLIPVAARPALIERVFYNLISNAIKYSAHRTDPVIEIGVEATPDGDALFVRDNGMGFDERDAAKLFKEFSRLPGSEQSDGLGLGLSLVNRLLRSHQGRIWAEGRPGQGATFYVRFPAASPATLAAAHLAR